MNLEQDLYQDWLLNDLWLEVKPTTKKELYLYLKLLGYDIPHLSICENHNTPLDFLWDAFSNKYQNILVWSNRSGDKSFLAGLLTFLRSVFFEGAESRILGGSLDQSEKCFKYFKNFIYLNKVFENKLKSEPTKRMTEFKNNSVVEILTQSEKSVRGEHVPFLILDEIDEFKVDIFEASLSIPQSNNNLPASIVMLSTMHKSYGVMYDLLNKLEDKNIKLYKWCFWEVLEECKNDCQNCELLYLCNGKGKQCRGHYKYDDLIQKKRILSSEFFKAEWLCERVEKIGVVYPEFDEMFHVEHLDYNPSISLDLSIDPSTGINPFVILFIQKDNETLKIIDEIRETGLLQEDIFKILLEKIKINNYNVRYVISDPENAEIPLALKRLGFNVKNFDKGKVEAGIELVKQKIKIRENNTTELKINKKCKNVIRELLSYHYKKNGEVDKVDDHSCDALRYYCQFLKQMNKQFLRII